MQAQLQASTFPTAAAGTGLGAATNTDLTNELVAKTTTGRLAELDPTASGVTTELDPRPAADKREFALADAEIAGGLDVELVPPSTTIVVPASAPGVITITGINPSVLMDQ